LNILLASNTKIPVFAYGGTERVIWDLGYALTQLGHNVTFLVASGSSCSFAKTICIDKTTDIRSQLPSQIDIAHFHFKPDFNLDQDFHHAYAFTEHGNTESGVPLPLNSIFVSRDHALRHGSDQYVHNGLNWDSYGPVNFEKSREHHHFLGKAAWRVKNVAGAIDVALTAKVRLAVLGGNRLNIKRGFRFTWSKNIRFHGMVGGNEKNSLLNASNGFIFPVRWHEPFGLAVVESLYFGCPVFSTPYGSLPELITQEYGYLSASKKDLANAVRDLNFDAKKCHAYALESFNARKMAKSYIEKYEMILDGETLNKAPPKLVPSEKFLTWN
jgi:glycosyltransferase involved in cell wall biosynthesis